MAPFSIEGASPKSGAVHLLVRDPVAHWPQMAIQSIGLRSLRKRLNELWQTSTTHRRAFLLESRRLNSASVRPSTT